MQEDKIRVFFLILMLLFCLQDFFLMMCAYIYSLKHLLKTEGTFSESYRIMLLIGRLYGILTAQVLLLKQSSRSYCFAQLFGKGILSFQWYTAALEIKTFLPVMVLQIPEDIYPLSQFFLKLKSLSMTYYLSKCLPLLVNCVRMKMKVYCPS